MKHFAIIIGDKQARLSFEEYDPDTTTPAEVVQDFSDLESLLRRAAQYASFIDGLSELGQTLSDIADDVEWRIDIHLDNTGPKLGPYTVLDVLIPKDAVCYIQQAKRL